MDEADLDFLLVGGGDIELEDDYSNNGEDPLAGGGQLFSDHPVGDLDGEDGFLIWSGSGSGIFWIYSSLEPLISYPNLQGNLLEPAVVAWVPEDLLLLHEVSMLQCYHDKTIMIEDNCKLVN